MATGSPLLLFCLAVIAVTTVAAVDNFTWITPASDRSYTIKEGSNFLFEWNTTAGLVDLNIFAGPRFANNNTGYDVQFLGSFNQGYMTYNWTAGPVGDGGNGIAYTFHLLLANSADGSCEGCNLNSPAFRVSENGLVYQPESDTTSASAGTTSTAAARPSDQSATAASVTSTASAAGNNDAARKAGIGIGVGAGLGGALGLSAIGAGLYVLRKRRNSRQMLVSDNVVLEVDGERQGKEKLGGALAELETQPAELRADAPPWELQAR